MSICSLGMVILNYNDSDETLRLLDEICSFPEIDRIVVVDNHSTDDSLQRLQRASNEKWDLVACTQNKGYAYGNNVGIRYLIETYHIELIGIANPDVVFDNAFIGGIKELFDTHTDYSVISGLQYGRDGKIFWHAFWEAHTMKSMYIDVLKKYPLIGRIVLKKSNVKTYVERELALHNGLFSVDTVGGCLFFIRANDMQEVGCFDENTFLYFEEDILAHKLKKANKRTGIDPRLSFVHKGSISINKAFPQTRKEKLMLRSQHYFVKNYVASKRAQVLLFDLIAEGYLLLLPLTLWFVKLFPSVGKQE